MSDTPENEDGNAPRPGFSGSEPEQPAQAFTPPSEGPQIRPGFSPTEGEDAATGRPEEIAIPAGTPRARPGFGARRRPGAAASGDTAQAGTRPAAKGNPLAGVNDKTKRRQQVLLASGAGVMLLAASYFITGDNHKKKGLDPTIDGRQEVPISTDAMVNKVEDNKTWMAQSSNRLNMQDGRIKQLEGETGRVAQLQDQIEQLKQQNLDIRNNGQKVIAAYESENQNLRTSSSSAGSGAASAPAGDPFRASGPTYGQAGGYDMQGAAMGPQGMSQAMTPAEVKVISFDKSAAGAAGGAGTGGGPGSARPDSSPVVVEDSPEYLPPNSYAPAKVIVGVDASAGVNSQTDPLPVVLRITGPARSVVQGGRVLTTRIEGCVINGAARGDLSAEKVYVKLAKMTCDQPGGRVAVSEVKGFISFAGKAGVRGRVVSREGSLVGQALLAGIAGGFGRGFAANTNAALTGVQIATNGKREELGAGDIVKGGLGNGVAEAGDMVSKYLIERAEQYQPIIEMPTGINVEIVFLDGAYVRTPR